MTSRISIITGAGSGVGARIAHRLAALGDRCVLVGRSIAKLESVAAEIGDPSGEGHLVLPADISIAEDRARIVRETLDRFGRIDTLVNNAGLAISEPMHALDEESLEQLFAVNGIGPVDLTRRVLPTMLEQRSGVVLSISSMACTDPLPGLGAYGCSKGALGVLPLAIRNEYGSKGLRAYTLCPGAIETGMLRSFVSEEMLPSSATLDPDAVAHAAVDLVTGDREAENGAVILMPSP